MAAYIAYLCYFHLAAIKPPSITMQDKGIEVLTGNNDLKREIL
tara:strand:+ start:1615 stop:1743 length:129 start_codon:yes stop_codon:yes gene_type:complete